MWRNLQKTGELINSSQTTSVWPSETVAFLFGKNNLKSAISPQRIGTCEVAPWIIDYFVNIALLDYITKLAISSAQFGLRKFLTP